MSERLYGFSEPIKDIPPSGETLAIAPPITAIELIGLDIPKNDQLDLETKPIHLYGYTNRVGKDTFSEYAAVINSPLRGRGLNELLLAIAPYRGFGLDTEDILTDWVDIDRSSNGMEARRERHSYMGQAWTMFQKEKPLILDLIGSDFLGYKKWKKKRNIPEGDGIIPVIFWRNYYGDKRAIPLLTMQEDQSSVLTDTIKDNHTAIIDGQGVAQGLSRTAGIWTLAHFSPDIKNSWPQYMGYSTKSIQAMGPTQASVLALLNSPSLLESKFLSSAEKYIEKYFQPIPQKK